MRMKGEGPVPCTVMLVGESPGREEDLSGRPFVGKSGKELSRILERNGLNRRECYITNICKERPPYVNGKQHAPTKEEIERDTPELIAELIAAQPKWIYAIGRVAARWFIGDHIDMESAHALAYPLSVRVRDLVRSHAALLAGDGSRGSVDRVAQDWVQECRVVPGYHPAAAMHNADLAPFVWYDIEQFGKYVNGKLHPITPSDPYTEPVYTENIDELPPTPSLFGGTVACDTEGLPGKVCWGGSVSCAPGTALVNRMPNTQSLSAVLEAAERIEETVNGAKRPNNSYSRASAEESGDNSYLLALERTEEQAGGWVRSSDEARNHNHSAQGDVRVCSGTDSGGSTSRPSLLQHTVCEPGPPRTRDSSREQSPSRCKTHPLHQWARANREERKTLEALSYETGMPHLRCATCKELPPKEIAIDTEGLPGTPWGLSVSAEAGTAVVVRVADGAGLRKTQELINLVDSVCFHNVLHDYPILLEMGIDVPWEKVNDTFLMAYCLRLVPRGLKPLSRRYFNMTMQSYLDVVAPADRSLAMEYVKRAIAAKQCPLCEGTGKIKVLTKKGDRFKKDPVKCTYQNELGERCDAGGVWAEREEQLKYDWGTGKWKISKGWSTGKYLNALKKDLDTDKYEIEDQETGEVLNVRERIKNWPDDVLDIIEDEIGQLPEPTLDDISAAAATYYSARDADATIRVHSILSEQIDALELREAYKLDLSVIPVAAEMQKNGMYVDTDYFAEFCRTLETDNEKILAELEQCAGRPINPASGDQVAALLFGERGLKVTEDDERELLYSFDLEVEKWTKSRSRASTDDKTLEAVKLKYAGNKELVKIVDLVIDYRVRHKILGTYARKLPLMVDADSYIHTRIKPCRTATFRWASADPNLQNIPTRPKGTTDLGKLVRRGFTAPPGYILGSWDFDQIEMRVLAWYSQDANLLRVFRENIDIHCLTAALVFRVPFEQFVAEYKAGDKLRKDQRTSAKNIGFGVVYGVTARGLQAQMELRGQNWTLEECQALIDMYLYEAYPGVGRFMMDAHAEARRTGMVRSLFGHIRYCPGVHSSSSSVREEALRQAANFKIQCTAAELLKVAMRTIHTEYKPLLDELNVKILMAVHDELLFQVPDKEEIKDIVDFVVTSAMTDPVPLDGVSISTAGKYAANWGMLKEVEDWKKVRTHAIC